MTRPRTLAALRGAGVLLALLLLTGAALFVARWGRPVEPFAGTENELLVRAPDQVHDQPGTLLPDEDEQWGAHGLSGWRRETLPYVHERSPGQAPGVAGANGEPVWVETNQPIATLRLPTADAGARPLSLLAWCPAPAGPEPTLTVRLNGVVLAAALVVPRVPAELVVEAPAAAWVHGENLLELESARDPESGAWNTVRLARLEYDAPQRALADLAARRLSLDAGTSVTYLVETRAPAQLALRAVPGAAGSLRLRFAAVDPETGEVAGDTLGGRALSAHALAAGVRLALPAAPHGLLALDLAWEAPDGGQLVLERLSAISRDAWPRPPIVFISIDTLAASHTSLHGYERDTTPNLRALAAESVVFERCLANAPWTMPSYLSVITGLYPQSHKLRDVVKPPPLQEGLASYAAWQVAENRWTLTELLRAMGYRTAGFVDTMWLWPPFRFQQGFDLYEIEPSRIGLGDENGGIALIHFLSKRWLDSVPPEAPFFLFVHALDAHGPYLPGPSFCGPFPVEEPPEGWTRDWAGSDFQTYRAIPEWMALTLVPAGQPIPAELPVEPIVARYDETIRKTDGFIGKILDELRARGRYDDALIVVSADHGEAFRDDLYGHGVMWQEILNVPLLVRLPRGAHGGTRVSDPAQLVDLYPTLLDVLGAERRDYLHGRSLLPAIEGRAQEQRPLYSEEGHCEQYMLEHDGWKLVVEHPGRQSAPPSLLSHPRVPREWLLANAPEAADGPLTKAVYAAIQARLGKTAFEACIAELRALLDGPFVSLYRVADDPRDEHDLSAQHPEVVERLERLLAAEQARWKRAQGHARAVPIRVELPEDALEQLEALGYAARE